MRINIKPITLFVLCALFASVSRADGVLKPVDIATSEWKPYVSQKMPDYGEVSQRITMILEQMGYQPNYRFMPWKEAEKTVYENAENTGTRGTFPFIHTEEREKKFYFSSEPVLKGCMVFFYNKDKIQNSKPVLTGLNDLKKYNIGFIAKTAGYQYAEELQPILEARGSSTENIYQLFSRLMDNNDANVQTIPVFKKVGQAILDDYFPIKKRNIAIFRVEQDNKADCLLPTKYYFIVSKLNPENVEFIRKFDKKYASLDTNRKERVEVSVMQRLAAYKQEVILDADNSIGFIKGMIDNTVYLIPRGTKGYLLSWTPNDKTTEVTAKVYLLTGPYRGMEMRVDGRYVKLQ